MNGQTKHLICVVNFLEKSMKIVWCETETDDPINDESNDKLLMKTQYRILYIS